MFLFNSLIKVISNNAIRCQTPARSQPGMVDVTISYKGKQHCKSSPGRFLYTQNSESSIDFLFVRLSKAVPKYPGDPPGVLPKVKIYTKNLKIQISATEKSI